MKAKTTIDERIKKHQTSLMVLRYRKNRCLSIIGKTEPKIQRLEKAIEKLEAKKVRQQKDQAIGDKLVESGVITEMQNREIQQLPEERGNQTDANQIGGI